MAEVYGQLVAEGWLAARQGSGTVVARHPGIGLHRDDSNGRSAARGSAVRRVLYDLKPGSPDLSAFPRAAWSAAARRALVAAPNADLGYGDPAGVASLRTSLARYLARARGVRTDPEHIVICAGAVQALALVCAVLASNDDMTLAVERFGLAAHRRVAEAAGLRTVPIGVDGAGARTDRLARIDANAVLLTPAHQFPLGVVLAPERRSAVVDWAVSTRRIVIEDDYDGEFRYGVAPLPALATLPGAADHVAYVGTSSKSVAPDLRVAWCQPPAALRREVEKWLAVHRRGPSSLPADALGGFIASGAMDRHLARAARVYSDRRARLVAALARECPTLDVTGVEAGLHLCVLLPGYDDDDVVLALERAGWRTRSLSSQSARFGLSGLVLSYSRLAARDADQFAVALREVLGG